MRSVVVVVLLAGCLDTSTVTCGTHTCISGNVCAPDGDTCTTQTQLDECAGHADGDGCSYPGTPEGVCYQQNCIPAGCGNNVIDDGEVCDDGNRNNGDGCSATCTSLEVCGDGVVDPARGETCDCGTAENVSTVCTGPNSDDPAALADCRSDCHPARCGDLIVDGGEECDDGNARSYDGCRADCAGRFTRVPTLTVEDFDQIWTDEVGGTVFALAIGDSSAARRWTGTEWVSIDTPVTGHAYGIWGPTRDNLYLAIGATGGLLHWNGTTLAKQTIVGSTNGIAQILAIGGSGPNDIYAVGTQVTGGGPGIYHFDGTQWTDAKQSGTLVTTVCGISTGSSAAVGALAANNVAIVMSSRMCRFDGTTWTGSAAPKNYTGFTLTSHGRIYAEHADGVDTGMTFDALAPLAASLPAFRGIGAVEEKLLVVGLTGLILEYDPNPATPTLTRLSSPTDLNLETVGASSAKNVFIGGGGGLVLH